MSIWCLTSVACRWKWQTNFCEKSSRSTSPSLANLYRTPNLTPTRTLTRTPNLTAALQRSSLQPLPLVHLRLRSRMALADFAWNLVARKECLHLWNRRCSKASHQHNLMGNKDRLRQCRSRLLTILSTGPLDRNALHLSQPRIRLPSKVNGSHHNQTLWILVSPVLIPCRLAPLTQERHSSKTLLRSLLVQVCPLKADLANMDLMDLQRQTPEYRHINSLLRLRWLLSNPSRNQCLVKGIRSSNR